MSFMQQQYKLHPLWSLVTSDLTEVTRDRSDQVTKDKALGTNLSIEYKTSAALQV